MNVTTADAGKTTLTEKLLLYGGAIHEAGAVKARRSAKHATSDWYETFITTYHRDAQLLLRVVDAVSVLLIDPNHATLPYEQIFSCF
jgi:hypothetical protein